MRAGGSLVAIQSVLSYAGEPMMSILEEPMMPSYEGACLSNVVPELVGLLSDQHHDVASFVPKCLSEANQIVLLVIDGLGWQQIQRYESPATLGEMEGGWITTVAPSTTAAALTSLATGLPPSKHGLVGYRVKMHTPSASDDVMNILRWKGALAGDVRSTMSPSVLQPYAPFMAMDVPVLTREGFGYTGFTAAHLRGLRIIPWKVPSSIPLGIQSLLDSGERLIYAYYDGVDKVAHSYGIGEHYLSELEYVDYLIASIMDTLPSGAALVITADHGQVHMDGPAMELDTTLLEMIELISGEGRFRWLHGRDGAIRELYDTAEYLYGDVAWIITRDQMLDEGWLGPGINNDIAARLGDVALVAREPVAFMDPADVGESRLKGRHGSLTREEMMVPFVTYLSE